MSKFRSPPQPGQSGSEEQDLQQPGTEYPQQPQYPPQQQQWQQPPLQPFPPQKPPKKHRVRRVLGIGCSSVIALIVLIVIIVVATSHGGTTTNSNTNSNTNTNTPSTATAQPTNQPTTAPTRAITPAPSFASFSDGTYQVGKDIQPGTYRTRVGSSNCYYERLSGFGGSTNDIIANNLTGAPAIVTIKSTDKGFSSLNCDTWTKDLSRITASKTSFDDGMFIVGTDITPGTYRDTGGSNCYYARLSGFGNTTDDILANNLVSAPAIVAISASDKGFETKGCGTWKKI